MAPSVFPKRNSLIAVAIALFALAGTGGAKADDLIEPTVFASSHGLLDIVMIAEPEPIDTLDFTAASGARPHPTGWIYKVCRRINDSTDCAAGPGTVSAYGGVRLALQAGDTLKIHLVNRLPAIDPAKLTHAGDPGEANLKLNPTNLHTHGLLVQARAPTAGDPTFGDYVFVSLFNRANGLPVPQTTHQHGSIVVGALDYRIDIPKNHPSGLFWFHPHIHGIALNQVSGGLAGIMTVGNVGDYARGDAVRESFPEANVRHLVLKDIQVLSAGTVQFDSGPAAVRDGEVLNQEDPGFCTQQPANAHETRHGACPGTDNSADGGSNFTGGKWFFTVNGQQYPTIRVADPDGEVWRLTNASGSVSYQLQLLDDRGQKPMVVQLLAIDGTSINLPQDTPNGKLVEMSGGKFRVAPCPPLPTVYFHSLPVCVDQLVMMPSARAEVWVTHRDANHPQAGETATLKMTGLTMGSGDNWPAVDLAKVTFAQSGQPRLVSHGIDVFGDALAAFQSGGILSATSRSNAANFTANSAASSASCKPLLPGHRRRIFFGLEDVTDGASFGLGYEEVDERGAVVPGTQRTVTRFDPTNNVICLPLGPEQTPARETWELVQLSTENHNFHIHQSRFQVVKVVPPGSNGESALQTAGGGILEDNVPLGVAVPHVPAVMDTQNGVCTSDQWRNGQCTSTPVVVRITFSQTGEFVYHCHILEHEDGGMMAKIQVVSSPVED